MDTASNASELRPGDVLRRIGVVVLKAYMLGNMEKSVSSVVGNSGSEDGKVRIVRKYTMR